MQITPLDNIEIVKNTYRAGDGVCINMPVIENVYTF